MIPVRSAVIHFHLKFIEQLLWWKLSLPKEKSGKITKWFKQKCILPITSLFISSWERLEVWCVLCHQSLEKWYLWKMRGCSATAMSLILESFDVTCDLAGTRSACCLYYPQTSKNTKTVWSTAAGKQFMGFHCVCQFHSRELVWR